MSSLSKELGVSETALYLRKRQKTLIDAGRAEGIKSFEEELPARIISWSWRAAAKQRESPPNSYGDFPGAGAQNEGALFSGTVEDPGNLAAGA